jgi:hypothetical protein
MSCSLSRRDCGGRALTYRQRIWAELYHCGRRGLTMELCRNHRRYPLAMDDAQNYRDKAAEAREMASTLTRAEDIEYYGRLAAQYEKMADDIDKGLPPPEPTYTH